jgi:hypothetical protein
VTLPAKKRYSGGHRRHVAGRVVDPISRALKRERIARARRDAARIERYEARAA